MPERHTTGGTKEFRYSKEDLERIQRTDTIRTREFKEALRTWRAHRGEERRLAEEFRKRRRMIVIILVLLAIMLAMLLALRLFS
jgi:hypothetical protein